MRTSILICATCLLVTGCSAQFRLPSLSSALSSLTGFGGSSSNSNGAQGGQSSSSSPTSPYSGLVRDYGRNLMMAMSSIYPTLFKPPQSQQQQQQQQPQAQQQAQPSPFESFSASQQQNLFAPQGGGGPSFTLGGSTFSISPSFPFGSLGGGGGSSQSQGAGPSPQGAGSSHSPFSASFGSSINSPPSFGPLSSGPFLSQSMPSFAPASSYGAAFEAANGGPSGANSQMFSSMGQPGPQSMQSMGSMPSASQLQANQLGSQSFGSIPSGFGSQHDSSAQILSQPAHHQQQSVSGQQVGLSGGPHSSGPFGAQQQGQQAMSQQFAGSQQFRPDMMSIAASAPVPSSNSYSNYGSVPAQQGQASSASISSSYQQPSYR